MNERPTAATRAAVAGRPTMRRMMVILGVAGSLLLAAATVRAAAMWAAESAPLGVAPVSLESVQQALEQERARSVALEAELGSLETASAELVAALQAAEARLGADTTTAGELRTSLDKAQARLAALKASLAASASQARTGLGSAGARTGDSDEHHDEEDHDEDVEHDD